jgi:ferredoxin--NADP+ reductase
MFKIINKEQLHPLIAKLEIEAPLIAKKRKAGQFVILRVNDTGERIPITIADSDTEKGTITIYVQEVGKSSALVNSLKTGDSISDVLGPLGKPTHVKKLGTVVIIGGGVGTAEALPIAQEFKNAGNNVIAIVGAREAGLLVGLEKMAEYSHRLIVCTDDGSKGVKGFVTEALRQLKEDEKIQIDYVLAVGPLPMMRAVSNMTRPWGIKTEISLNSIMIDGTGMCGGCRVTVGGETRFVCVDGPEFDAHEVDFDVLQQRQRIYLSQEKESYESFKKA